MKRTSKYLNKEFDNGWVCTFVGLARKQSKYLKKSRTLSKNQNMTYYYIFERMTSDNKAQKMIRLNATLAAKVYRKEITVESILEQREQNKKKQNKFITKVSYHFI